MKTKSEKLNNLNINKTIMLSKILYKSLSRRFASISLT